MPAGFGNRAVLIDQFHQFDLARPNSATCVEVDAQCQPRQGLAAGWVSAAGGETVALLVLVFHFGAVAEGRNSCSPATLYAPIAACPSGDSSHSANRRAEACLGTGCFAGFSRITS